MSRVFTWAEVRDGRIPRLESFGEVVDEVRCRLGVEPGVIGGVLCGSVLIGRQTRRSDIDCAVVYDRKHRATVLSTFRGLYRFARRRRVPLELIPIDASVAGGGRHTIGGSFRDHLRRSTERGGLIKADPMPFIRQNVDDGPEDVYSYLRSKVDKLEKGTVALAGSDQDRQRALREVVHTPFHIARKMLWQLGRLPDPDARPAVVERFCAEFGPELARLLLAIDEADKAYGRELDWQLTHPCDRARYVLALQAIGQMADTALDFFKHCAAVMDARR